MTREVFHAYLVAILRPGQPKGRAIAHAGVFSEAHPTVTGAACSAVIAEFSSEDSYESAKKALLEHAAIAMPWLEVKP